MTMIHFEMFMTHWTEIGEESTELQCYTDKELKWAMDYYD